MLSAVFVAALGSGIGLAFLLANLDDTVKTLNELVESFGIPVVGAVTLVALPARRRRFKRQVFTFADDLLRAVHCIWRCHVHCIAAVPNHVTS